MTRKLAVYSPMHMTVAPAMPNSEPTRKPMLLPDPLHQQRRRKHPDHHADMLHRDRQVGEIGAMIEGDDRKPRRRKHHGVAGLADRLAAGEQQEIAAGAPVEGLLRIGFRLEPGIGV